MILLPISSWGQSTGTTAHKKADSLAYHGHYKSSDIYYKKAAHLFEKAKNWKGKISALYELSVSKNIQGNPKKATHFLSKAHNLAKKYFPTDRIFRIKYLYQQANIAKAQARYKHALKTLVKAKEEIPDTLNTWHAKILTAEAEIFTAQGSYNQAVDKLREAEKFYHEQKIHSQKILSRIYNSLGTAFKGLAQYTNAAEYYKKSLQLDKELLPFHHPELAKSNNNIAIIYYYQSDYKRALDYLKNAVNVLIKFHGSDHRLVARGYNNIGIVYSEIDELKQAVSYLKKALTIRKKKLGKHHPDIAIAYQNLGAIYFDMQQYDKAITCYSKSKKIHLTQFPEGHPELANVYANLGQAHDRKGNYKKALTYYQKDLSINKKQLGTTHPFIGDTYTKVGETYSKIDNYQEALTYFEKAIAIFADNYDQEIELQQISLDDILYPAALLETLRLKSQVQKKYARQQEELPNQSLQTYLQTVQLINMLQQSYNREQSKFLLRERTAGIYKQGFETAYQLYKETNATKYKEYAFFFAGQSQNQILIEQIQKENAEIVGGIPDSLLQRETNLRSRLTELQQKLSTLSNNPLQGDKNDHFALEDSLFHLQKKLTDHIRFLESSYPKYYQLKYRPPSTKVSKVQQKVIDSEETIIQYFFGQNDLFAFIIGNKSFDIHRIASDSLVEDKIKLFRKALNKESSASAFSQKSYALYKLLFKPIEHAIRGKKVLVIPDGILNYLPFESFVTQPQQTVDNNRFSSLKYLIEQYTFSYAPSATYLATSNKLAHRNYDKKLLGFAPVFSKVSEKNKRALYPDYNRPLPSLPLSKKELNHIQSVMDNQEGLFSFLGREDNNTQTFFEERATENAFKEHIQEGYEYIHLATHAYVSEQDPSQSGILFSVLNDTKEDGTLHASEIYNLSINAKLVALSACKTGVGEIAEGEGIMSLSRAFQYAGAQNLLVSLWNVDDRATSVLMTTFYEMHSNTASISEALQKTKIKVIHNKRYAHPKYWASFVFIGH